MPLSSLSSILLLILPCPVVGRKMQAWIHYSALIPTRGSSDAYRIFKCRGLHVARKSGSHSFLPSHLCLGQDIRRNPQSSGQLDHCNISCARRILWRRRLRGLLLPVRMATKVTIRSPQILLVPEPDCAHVLCLCISIFADIIASR